MSDAPFLLSGDPPRQIHLIAHTELLVEIIRESLSADDGGLER